MLSFTRVEGHRAALCAARWALVAILFVSASSPARQTGHTPISLEDLRIDVPRDSSREIAYTNKEAGVFYTETNGRLRSAWQGWRVMSTEIMKGYSITLDGAPLLPATSRAAVFPHQIVRSYPNGVTETVTLVDSVNAIVVELDNVAARRLLVRPLFSPRADEFITKVLDGVLLVARKSRLTRSPAEDYPVWLGIAMTTPARAAPGARTGEGIAPAGLQGVMHQSKTTVAIVLGETETQTAALAANIAAHARARIASRSSRMERLLNRSYARTGNARFDKALRWAKISLDALVMHQLKRGIFAGLPWFDNYWGRDSFIALSGATLVTGSFGDAREILLSFAEWQDTNASQTTYGRIPNLVTTSSIAYNTADGTPRFVIALDEYARSSGDTDFARRLWPVVRRSIDGTLRYHADSLGFLLHGDAESWMDAAGPEGPWSPRGDRANDVQELWYRQLTIGVRFAQTAGDPERANRYERAAELLRSHFSRQFVDTASGLIADHLRPDGTRDGQLRPNQLFVDALASDGVKRSVFDRVTRELVYPYGVASLSQNDEEFHPYHHYSPAYVQDAAYHNGIVWTWLAGTWIERASGCGLSDLAFRVTENMEHQILDRGAVGTLSELLDAAPRPGEREPRLSGTYSQAWSLAEFTRTFYQAYCGVRVDATLRRIELSPALPGRLGQADFDVAMGDESIHVAYRPSADSISVHLTGHLLRSPLTVAIRSSFPHAETRTAEMELAPEHPLSLTLTRDAVISVGEGGARPLPVRTIAAVEGTVGDLTLASPVVRTSLKALRGPSYRVLAHAEIKRSNPRATLLCDMTDPPWDDSTYQYPQTRNLLPGSLDITRFTLRADERNAYFSLVFRNLSNPGWHPEYGFQLTCAAIAVDKEGRGAREVGMNSLYRFDSSFAYETMVFVGGGLRVLNDSGAVLAEYLPVPGDEHDPLGSTRTKTISFSLPLELLGKPRSSWRYAVLVGCQDDHGGAGVGEFRSVEATAKEWTGGGKRSPQLPNVYDQILPPNGRHH
jgi:glycogen debranching enzyme